MSSLDDIPFTSKLDETKFAIESVIKAGEVIMQVYSKDFSSELKSDKSPITEADLKSNQIIRKVLSKSNLDILSEEEKDDLARLENEKLWIVDPLDGTTDFVNRTGEFTVMIALVENKKPILGVIGWPTNRTLFIAQKGQGAYQFSDNSWEKISVSQIDKLEEYRAVGSRHHLSDEEKELLKKLGIIRFTSIGSSLKVGKISAGLAELYLTTTNKMKEWDTCASYCLINEAGGMMTDMLGNDITYNNKIVNHQNGILVSNGVFHNKIVEEFRKLRKQVS